MSSEHVCSHKFHFELRPKEPKLSTKPTQATPEFSVIEVPNDPSHAPAAWGSDHIADLLRALDFEYIALNPGSSYRGFHDSLVNHLGNERPTMLLCLHEESAVAIAHGWSKVTGRAMAVAVHSNVGLMHASMAIYNAWCDRVPMLILGGGGPLDAAKRRPWIDWIHSSRDQAALIRPFIKWDDHPGSIPAAQEALLRACILAETAPKGPVYISLDAALQESEVPGAPPVDVSRYAAPASSAPDTELLKEAAQRLSTAQRPLILVGRVSRGESDWRARVELAERFGALVLTDLKQAAAFPTSHRLHAAPSGMFPTPRALKVFRVADVVLSLDWADLAGLVSAACADKPADADIIHVSLDQYAHNGWSMDHLGLAPADLRALSDPDSFVAGLLAELSSTGPASRWKSFSAPEARPETSSTTDGSISTQVLARALREALGVGLQQNPTRPVCLVRTPLSWAGDFWPINHPLDMLGYDGGGGIGSGPGMAVGAALALRGTGRLPLAVLGDGDFIMGVSAVWTAVHYEIPVLIVIVNNRSFFNDEMHQERVARQRGRPVANRWIGQRISNPDIDLAAMASAQGATAIGPIKTADQLPGALRDAISAAEKGHTVVVDVRTDVGYQKDFSAAASA